MNTAEVTTCTRCGQPPEAHAGTQRELASRTMTARRDGTTCPRCRAPIRRGQRIGLVGSKGWCHTGCVTGRQPPEIRWPAA